MKAFVKLQRQSDCSNVKTLGSFAVYDSLNPQLQNPVGRHRVIHQTEQLSGEVPSSSKLLLLMQEVLSLVFPFDSFHIEHDHE